MKMWIVREHRGDSFCLFLQEEKPVQGEDKYWYHKGGIRGLKVPRLLFPEILFPKMGYDSPMKVELKLIEGLAEDTITTNEQPFKPSNISLEKEMEWNLPEGYIFKDENGNVINATKIVLKKKKEYPKTYEECCKVLGCKADHFFTDFSYKGCDIEISDYEDKIDDLLKIFRKLIYCRNAYWKLYGEEMGLGKPWEPDWEESDGGYRYCIVNVSNNISLIREWLGKNYILSFPTSEMRDAFKENFDPDIEFCKEFL